MLPGLIAVMWNLLGNPIRLMRADGRKYVIKASYSGQQPLSRQAK